MESRMLKPVETARFIDQQYPAKTRLAALPMLLLAVMAGAFIALAGEVSNLAIHDIQNVGLARTLAGLIFPTGLMLVVLTGSELFTGNCLLILPLLSRQIKLPALLRNWGFVYVGNFLGSLLIVALIALSGQWNFSAGLLGGYTIKVAVYKATLTFTQAFAMGVLCNLLVCLAVWMAVSAKDVTGKLLACFFPIWMFITSGFEHSVANMYYIPAGIIAKQTTAYADKALALGVSQQQLDALDWSQFLTGNLLPVTLGNIVGGGLLIAAVYWFCLVRPNRDPAA